MDNDIICSNHQTKIIMLDLDSFLFKKAFEQQTMQTIKDEQPIDVLPIFIRIWSDQVNTLIVWCIKPIY